MTTRTTTIRVHDAQLRLLEFLAERKGVSVADVQRNAFSAYIDACALDDDEFGAVREKVVDEWKHEDDARGREARQQALGKSVT